MGHPDAMEVRAAFEDLLEHSEQPRVARDEALLALV
jgi:hypothetical protein